MTEETIKYTKTKKNKINLNDHFLIILANISGHAMTQMVWACYVRIAYNPGYTWTWAKKAMKMNIEDFPMELTYFHPFKY